MITFKEKAFDVTAVESGAVLKSWSGSTSKDAALNIFSV